MDDLMSWIIEDQVLTLTLPKYLTTELLEQLNKDVHQVLDKSPNKVIIHLNTVDLSVSYQTADLLRETQTFVKHANLDCVIVTAGNKLNRLIMLMAFSTARIPVMQFDNQEGINDYLQRRGIPISA